MSGSSVFVTGKFGALADSSVATNAAQINNAAGQSGFGQLSDTVTLSNPPTGSTLSLLTGALGAQTNGVPSQLGNVLTPINPQSVSFESIKADLVSWATNKPAGVPWLDWFETDDGTIIAEWIAGLATFRKLAEIMRVRESALDYAQLESSIYELAFNRGLLVPPASAPILQLTLTVAAPATVPVMEGDLIGTIGTYQLYALEGKTLSTTDTLLVAVGHLNTYSPPYSTLKPFTTFKIPVIDKYVAQEMESFVAGGQVIPLVSEPNNLNGFGNTFILRRITPTQVRIYVGNGVMGWYSPSVAAITYTCLSYGDDVTQNLRQTPSIAIAAELRTWTMTQPPSFNPDKETLRAIARYYPIDGRIVQDSDYESTIRKYYGGVLYDVYAYNTDPEEQIYLLANSGFGVGTNQATEQLTGIQALVDSKRGLGMKVNYYVVDPAIGKNFALQMWVPDSQYSYSLQTQVNSLTRSQTFRFARANVLLTAVSFATQLSAMFGIQFTPFDDDVEISLLPTDFLASFTINLASSG